MIISRLNLLRFNYFASVIEFKTRFVETMKRFVPHFQKFRGIQNSKQLMSHVGFKIAKQPQGFRLAVYQFLTPKIFETKQQNELL